VEGKRRMRKILIISISLFCGEVYICIFKLKLKYYLPLLVESYEQVAGYYYYSHENGSARYARYAKQFFFFPGVMRHYVSVTVYIFLLVYIVYISCISKKLKLPDKIMYGP
jgi:hypothetical protein